MPGTIIKVKGRPTKSTDKGIKVLWKPTKIAKPKLKRIKKGRLTKVDKKKKTL